MTLSNCRLVTSLVLLAIAPVQAQLPSRLEAGGGTGGSAFGWQPRVGLSGETQTAPVGPWSALLRGAFARTAATGASQYELLAGARLSWAATPTRGVWLGGDVVRRNGFKDAIEQPRIETGGWQRVGNVVVSVSAVRRSAAVSGNSYFSRTITSYNSFQDSTTGQWDSTQVVRTITDSTRRSGLQRWAETQAAVAWEGQLVSVDLAMGGRLASRGVPSGAWASANLAVRLSAPLSLVLGAGNSTGGRFALDAEHRYVTLGFRISPSLTRAATEVHPLAPASAVSPLAIEAVGEGRYRLALRAPRASRVEISGDFTGWKPVTLEPGSDGRWTLTMPLAAGTHRLNVRIDGGSWIVPPGLTTMNDDFAGEVGLVVIESASEREPGTEGVTK